MTIGPFGPHYPLWGVSGSYLNGKATNLVYQTFDLQKLSRILPQSPDEGIYFDAELVPERDNPDSPFSVSIRWQGLVLGYMSLRESTPLFPELSRIAASHFTPITPARLWTNPSKKNFRLNYAIPKPGHVAPINNPPLTEFALMPNGSALQVQGEENHLDYLASYLPGEGAGRLYLTLEFPEGGDRFNVLLDGQVIGTLTAAMSKKLLPPIQQFIDRGLDVAVRGKISGSQFDCQVTVNIARAHEFTEEDMLTGPAPHQELIPVSDDGYALPIIWSEDEPDWSVMVYPDGTIWEESTPSFDDVEDEPQEQVAPIVQEEPQVKVPSPVNPPQPEPIGDNPFLHEATESEKSPEQVTPPELQAPASESTDVGAITQPAAAREPVPEPITPAQPEPSPPPKQPGPAISAVRSQSSPYASTPPQPVVPSYSEPPRKRRTSGVGKQILVGGGAFLAALVGGFILFAILFNIGGGTDAIGWILFLLWLAGVIAAPIWAVKKVKKSQREDKQVE